MRYPKSITALNNDTLFFLQEARLRAEKVLQVLAPGNDATDAELRRKWPELRKIST